ncbi:hypothetical protein [uncultured Martelella sp.]|uniref:hypothetical protein n=1 Tax=uncultured Martelella sp. TaxID=392331 RepID=UPI0037489305
MRWSALGAAAAVDPEKAQTPQHTGAFAWGGACGNRWLVGPVEKLGVVVLTNMSVNALNIGFLDRSRSSLSFTSNKLLIKVKNNELSLKYFNCDMG